MTSWRRRMRWSIAPLSIAAGALLSACEAEDLLGVGASTDFGPGTALHSLQVGSLKRDYILHVPSRRPTTPSGTLLTYPLIILLHGSSGSGGDIRALSNMDSVGDANRLVVAYPNGIRGSGGLFPSDWNAGTCCGAAGRENIDDVAFIRSMIAELSNKMPIDKRRVYVAGFSDGGRMAYRLACEMATQIAAIGVVAGSLRDESCAPARAVPVIAIHGTDDPIVPYDEDSDTPYRQPVSGVGATLPPAVQFWIAQNGCSTGATTAHSARVAHTTFSGCVGAEVAFYAIDGGGHSWPVLTGAASSDPEQSLAATAVIGQFFRRQAIR